MPLFPADEPRKVVIRAHEDPRAVQLAALLVSHEPASERERRSIARTFGALKFLDRPFDEHADPMHVTGSAIVVDGAGHVILHRHKRLGLWMQPGGHVDGDEQPHEGAVREVEEEVGIDVVHPDGVPLLLHVDVHPGPRGHTHLDLRYLLVAAPDSVPAPAEGESPDVRWFTFDEVDAIADESTRLAVARVP